VEGHIVQSKPQRSSLGWITALLACALAAPALAQSEGSGAQASGAEAGVTDLTRTPASVIETNDIIEALAVPRGTRIEATAPPTIRLPVYFEFNSTELRPEAKQLLEKVGAALAAEELSSFQFSVEGHTDSVGSNGYNVSLSSQRAGQVARYLEDRGVSASRLETVGRGEVKPVGDNTSAEGRQRNRRVELINLGAQP
jgi:outer membrane protein OmpA-like peptidoglycan-associated protein